MQTIKELLITSLAEKGAEYVADSTCWNIHSFKASKNSNLAKKLSSLPRLEKPYYYLIVVGKKGRSQHSESDLHIFKVSVANTIGTVDTLYCTNWYETQYTNNDV